MVGGCQGYTATAPQEAEIVGGSAAHTAMVSPASPPSLKLLCQAECLYAGKGSDFLTNKAFTDASIALLNPKLNFVLFIAKLEGLTPRGIS